MAESNSNPLQSIISTANTNAPDWDLESQHLSALAHLSVLQDRIDALRDAVPSVIRPLTTLWQSDTSRASESDNESRTWRIMQIKDAATDGAKNIKELRQAWLGDSESKAVWDRVDGRLHTEKKVLDSRT